MHTHTVMMQTQTRTDTHAHIQTHTPEYQPRQSSVTNTTEPIRQTCNCAGRNCIITNMCVCVCVCMCVHHHCVYHHCLCVCVCIIPLCVYVCASSLHVSSLFMCMCVHHPSMCACGCIITACVSVCIITGRNCIINEMSRPAYRDLYDAVI